MESEEFEVLSAVEADIDDLEVDDLDDDDLEDDDLEDEFEDESEDDVLEDETDYTAKPAKPVLAMSTLPVTGEARVDDALGRLTDLTNLPVHEHVAVFEDVQRRLHETLADLTGQ